MTVQELFKEADANKVATAYFLIYTDSFKNDFPTIQEMMFVIDDFKDTIVFHCDEFCKCEPILPEDPETIFVLEYESMSLDEKGEKFFDACVIHNKEALEKIEQNQISEIAHYAIDMMSLQEMAGCDIADISFQMYGAEVCCAVILSELFWFGLTDETRAERVEEETILLEERVREYKESPDCGIPADQVFAEIWEEMLKHCEDEDERAYMQFEMEFDNATRDIQSRYAQKVCEKNTEISREAILSQFTQNLQI